MPYQWITTRTDSYQELHLWPHQSLPPEGYVRFLGVLAALITIPMIPLLGSAALWGVLPFVTATLFAVKWALDRSRRDRHVLEVLTLDPSAAHLERINPTGARQNWSCNRYWTEVELHTDDGPVPNYVTLRGSGREVEIGAFLSEDERKALYDELRTAFRKA
ncbi:Integral membrane protein [Phaeobacter piscinae]|uniref:Integral membrane protein n=1 Tax=Phaeobacter piscinae TaxID=1580596 RepID=A0ABM6PAU2_9RHOB|nr:DUF2244 domain-containing protein [Phaeobacter piscinae]ATG34760.1 Integral membrane protein [Phaeobacter piscinae]AUQ85280.1 Integral membrane protein [Phaeobacter piscinae]AUR23164.1 Integral membrane protein [Phaeobacter piscinae]